MFQIPVQNLDNIRRSRKKVKGILVDIGLDSCQELLQTLKSFDPGEKYFCNTSWNDVSHWDNVAKRKRYRTNPYCCSLCKFSSKFLNSFKNHLNRYHEDEMDQELVVPCPECSFASHSKIVGKHLRMFHSKKKIQNYNVSGGMRQFRNDAVNFVCQKCQFTDMLYYNTKKHVLVNHFQNLISTYFEERPDESEENFTDHYCKKCNAFANSRDSLIYHVLTSEVHKDLENILGRVISVQPKKPGQTKSLQIINIAPKPSTAGTASPLIPTSVGSNSTSRLQLSLPSVNQNQNMVSTKAVHNMVTPLGVSGSSNSMTASTSVDQLHITLLPGPRPGSQNNVGLQPAVSQPVFVSHRYPLKQPVRPGVLCLNQPTGNISRAVPPGVISFTRPIRPTLLPVNQSVRTISSPIMPGPGPIPVNRPSSPGILAVNRPIGSGPGILPVPQAITSGVLQFNHPVTPGVLPVNPSVGPGIVQFNQPVTPEVLPVNQSVRPGVCQNPTLLTGGPILRQLIPTGKQVNGIPTYTLAPVSVTLPGPPGGGVATVPPPQLPVQLMQPGPVTQLSQGPATVPSPVVVSSTNSLTKTSSTSSAMSLVLKQAKQWKTCPVCSELFPSNVYQVHMQVAHKCSTSKTEITLEIDKVAACAPFLRWLKDKTVRCFSCKCFLSQAELIKHIFIHGLTCLFCTSVFHDLKCLVDHTRTLHNGKKKLHSDYDDKGFQLVSDSEDHLVFPHFDFSITSKELCEKEVHLVVLAGVNSRTLIPLYIKLQHEGAEMSRENKKVSTCPFCYGTFTSTEAYEIHLKERHHIMPTVHTILKSPAFKCIHCCGVYTGNMTLTAIAVHLLRCRSAPKDTTPAVKMQLELDEKQDLPLMNGENHDNTSLSAKRKQSDHLYAVSVSEDQSSDDQPFLIINSGTAQIPIKEVNCVPSKRQKTDHKTETKGESSVEDLHVLVLNPKPFQQSSNEVQKRFLADYFHKKPYPSKKELELLSSILCAWKVDVASFFGRKRYFCLKAIKNFKPSVLLGFSMSELKNVKHSLNLKCELEGV
ncbi:activity-dependent neuroprotector homeobox protein 2 [Python bivittatus]|uniref:Activity-dependent neuroprotector homeobox protein 2 n=1 Tax=Python bivittatus TaxID=176946 RepID=A0A9F2Q416_PYTBI|nr:activity-dependent neuroprotector homeobox protein 2 [Python bivittatus]XP_007426493.1 activity-dependent neuroprotector homeobox protein 2 [Python bivittatus]XP_007426494.1 activity-dependent neuroprotector homeobox protein 2 [Python bivittatus]XP_007426496.1 activity-dependent neuroprotector homeobox protein 2 [Python bivittatus]XP_025021322.1 activity-dependent neuroprotector homeobox protein 2 [Python bivittatus]XP_025021323.1 activity-dependent neuroprotector homeobox protein 2 [Python